MYYKNIYSNNELEEIDIKVVRVVISQNCRSWPW